MPTTGIVTYVHGWYRAYVPLFIRGCQLAYPEYPIRIVHGAEEMPQCAGATFHEVRSPHTAEKPYYMRWLLPPEIFDGLDYAFLGDVDLILLREVPTLTEIRQAIMRRTGQPFANWVRAPAAGYPSRITGWHFIEVRPYFDKVWPFASRVLADKDFDITQAPSYAYDNGFGELQWGQEALLYRLLSAACQLGPTDQERELCFANHHGVHLGPLRAEPDLKKIAARLGLNGRFWLYPTAARRTLSDPDYLARAGAVSEPHVLHVITRAYQAFGLAPLLKAAQTDCQDPLLA